VHFLCDVVKREKDKVAKTRCSLDDYFYVYNDIICYANCIALNGYVQHSRDLGVTSTIQTSYCEIQNLVRKKNCSK
jgi:hypothetical protein